MLTRRTATVTTSAPDASMAFCVSMKSLYFPVPTQRRERKSMPAIVNRSALIVVVPPPADKADDFHLVTVPQRGSRKHPAVHDFEIQLHGDPLGLNAQIGQEGRHRLALRDLASLAVQRDAHREKMIPYGSETLSMARAHPLQGAENLSYNPAMVPPRNQLLAGELRRIAAELENRQANPFRVRAYRQAARLIERLTEDAGGRGRRGERRK